MSNFNFSKKFSNSNTENSTTVDRNEEAKAQFEAQHQDYAVKAAAYAVFCQQKLADVVTKLTGKPFSKMFAESTGTHGEFVVTINPEGKNGQTWTANCSGMIRAFLAVCANTESYVKPEYHWHEKLFDASLPKGHSKITAFENGEYHIFTNSVGRLVKSDLPWWPKADTESKKKVNEKRAGWMSKHVEMDVIIQALLTDTAVSYHFFDKNGSGAINKARWERLVKGNLGVTVAAVNKMLEENDDGAKAYASATYGDAPGPVGPVIVDGVDLSTLKTAQLRITMKAYSTPAWVDANRPQLLDDVRKMMASKDYVSAKIEKQS